MSATLQDRSEKEAEEKEEKDVIEDCGKIEVARNRVRARYSGIRWQRESGGEHNSSCRHNNLM